MNKKELTFVCANCGATIKLNSEAKPDFSKADCCENPKYLLSILGNHGNKTLISYGEYLSYKNNKFITQNENGEEVLNIFENSKEIKKNEAKIKQEDLDLVLERFKQPEVMELIKEEISKDHLGDNNQKMTLFKVCISGLLENPTLRQSALITGNTAEGKGNLVKSILKHMPPESFEFITSGTTAVLQDDLKDLRILAIDELNLFREGGANNDLIETIKQRTEGGIKAVKKDLSTNNKTLRISESQQGTTICTTTDLQKDSELQTRLINLSITANYERIKKVNSNTFETFADENKILEKSSDKNSWIRIGLTNLFREPNFRFDYVVLPFAKYLKEQINGKDIFDHNNARSQRDIKRLLALTCATAFIHQLQRERKEVKSKKFLVAQIEDFILTMENSLEFFDQTYQGFDSRLNDVLELIKPHKSWIDKKIVQDGLNIQSRGTINKYLNELEDSGLIEKKEGKYINEQEAFNGFVGNHVYIRSVQKAFKRRLLSVTLEELEQFLRQKTSEKEVSVQETSVQLNQNEGKESEKEELDREIAISTAENEHLKLNASELDEAFKDE